MAKAKKTETPKKPRAPREIEAPTAAMIEYAKKQMARDDISNCAAVREVAAKFKTAKRGTLVALLTSAPFKMAKGTVSTQIQQGRSAA